MIRRALYSAVMLVMLSSSTGCCCFQRMWCHMWDCGKPCDPHGGGSQFCGHGCGEEYCGDWHSYPPDCCDPCDCCGHWTGHGGPEVSYQQPYGEPPMVHGEYHQASHVSHGPVPCNCGHH